MRTSLFVALLTLGLACGGGAPDTPAAVAEAYLRANDDPSAATALLAPRCQADERMVRVDAARVMGAAIEIDLIDVSVATESETAASVHYSVGGPAHSEGGTTTILGATVQTGAVDMDNATKAGVLTLIKVEGDWRISC